jgi:hypothetical protein
MCGTVLELCVALLLNRNRALQNNQFGVRGCLLSRGASHTIMQEEGVERRNTTEAQLIDRTTFHHLSLWATKSPESVARPIALRG